MSQLWLNHLATLTPPAVVHLPADHFTKPILRALGVAMPADTKSRAICGVEAPRWPYRELVEGPPLHPDQILDDPQLLNYPRANYLRAGAETHGYFSREPDAAVISRDAQEFYDAHRGQGSANFANLYRRWLANAQPATRRWFLRFRDVGGETIADHLGRIDCPGCRVALDLFLESHRYPLTIEVVPGRPAIRGFADSWVDEATEDPPF